MSWGRNEVLLSAGSLLLALLAAEGTTRLILPRAYRVNHAETLLERIYQPDPLIGWVLSAAPKNFHHRLVYTPDGSVSYDVAYHMGNGERRTSAQPFDGPTVITAGCSYTFGQGLEDEETWPGQLQQKLRGYRVVNTASMAYGTDQALMAAARKAEASPNTAAVVLGFVDFQIERNRGAQGWIVDVPPFTKPLFRTTPDGMAAYSGQVRTWALGGFSDHSELIGHFLNGIANRYYRVPSHEEAKQLTVALITTFAHRFQQKGIHFAVVMLPWHDDQSAQPRSDRAFILDHLRAAHVTTLVPDFPRLPDGRFDTKRFTLAANDRHPNRDYDRIVAEELRRLFESASRGSRQSE